MARLPFGMPRLETIVLCGLCASVAGLAGVKSCYCNEFGSACRGVPLYGYQCFLADPSTAQIWMVKSL